MTAPFTWNGFARGARDGVPLGVSIFVYGLAFGLVAAQATFGVGKAVVMSAALYSGSAQLASVNLIQSGLATVPTIVATILVINARYLLFSAALQPWLGQARPVQAYGSLLLLGDANWIFVMKAIAMGEADRAYLAGTGAPMLAGWLAGTAVGVVTVSVLPAPEMLGLDLMLPAFAAAMMAAMMKTRASLIPVAVGAVTALTVARFLGPSWGIIAAGLMGGIVAASLWRAPRNA